MGEKQGYVHIITAGTLFGTIPIFATVLNQLAVSALEQNFFRILISAIILILFFLVTKTPFSIKRRDYAFFCLFGLTGIALFFVFYVSAILMTSVSVAVLLLYTEPLFTLILARFILKERISAAGFGAIILSVLGVSVLLKAWTIPWYQLSAGHLFGLLAGLSYALYIIFGRVSVAHKKYTPATVTLWSFLFGLVWLIPLWFILSALVPLPVVSGLSLALGNEVLLLLIGFALIATVFPYALLEKGLGRVKSHRAGVLILFEPITAIVLGALLLNQFIDFEELVGAVFILIAAYLIIWQHTARIRHSK